MNFRFRKCHDELSSVSIKHERKTMRYSAGTVFEDPTLDEWPDNDYRIFVGDLGIEANDELLGSLFKKYSSFNKAKVIKDKKTNKNKGYGFVSFMDPFDCMKAIREMNGKYCGNRPMKIKKSQWEKKDEVEAKKRMKGARKFAKAAAARERQGK